MRRMGFGKQKERPFIKSRGGPDRKGARSLSDLQM